MIIKKLYLKYYIAWFLTLILATIFFIPVIGTITNSLMTIAEIKSRYSDFDIEGAGFFGLSRSFGLIPSPISFEQYWTILITDYKYIFMFWQSLKITLLATLFNVLVSSFTGFAFGKINFIFKKTLFTIYTIVLFMPFSVTLLPNYLLVKWLNIFDTHLALILPATFAPLGVLLIAGFSKNILNEYFEAASLETNSYISIFVYIVLPILRPAIAALVVITFSEIWNMVEQPLILLKDPLKYPLSVALNYYGQISSAFAGAVIYFIPVIILFLFFEDEMLTELINLGGSVGAK